MKLLTKVEFLNRVPFDDVYLVGIEDMDGKRVFHVLAYSEELDEKPGKNEPTFLYIPEDTEHEDLWDAIAEQLDSVKLYGGAFDEMKSYQEHYENSFLPDETVIVKVENTSEALSLLRIIAATHQLNEKSISVSVTIVI